MKKINKTTLYIFLTLGISYSLVGFFYFMSWHKLTIGGMALGISYMFIPALSTLIIEKWVHQQEIKNSLFISFKWNKWFFVAWFIPPLVSIGAFGVSLLLPGVSYSPDMEGMFAMFQTSLTPEQVEDMRRSMETIPVHPFWLSLLQGLFAGITFNALAGFGEELGWRGFLLKQFQKLKFIHAAIAIGFIWGIWHAPLILLGQNYPAHPVPGVFMMTIWCILLSPLFVYVTIKSRSVIAPSILHGTLNATIGLSIMMIKGGNDLINGTTGLAGCLTLLIFNFIFFLYDHYVSKEKVWSKEISKSLDQQKELLSSGSDVQETRFPVVDHA